MRSGQPVKPWSMVAKLKEDLDKAERRDAKVAETQKQAKKETDEALARQLHMEQDSDIRGKTLESLSTLAGARDGQMGPSGS